jgi:ribosomal protein L30/L7E
MPTVIRRTLLLLILSLAAFHSYSQKIMKTYYDYYNIKLKEEYQIDKNGFKNGYYKSFHQNKMPYEVGQYKDDLKTGVWKTYEEDGKLKEEATFKEDKYNGIAKVWINGKGFHNPGADHYYEMDNEIRTITYYQEGGIQSDIKKDGECKYLYRNTKPAKIWQNQDFKPVSSSVKIWSDDGQPFELQKTVRGINFTYNSDVEFDYSGERSGQIGYYITPPTEFIGDSAGWKIAVYDADVAYIGNASYYSFITQKDKADTTIIFTYLLNRNEAGEPKNFLWDLKFLDHPKTYLSEAITYISKPRSTDKITIKTTYNDKGEIVKKETGTSQFNRNTDKYIFTSQTQSANKTFGVLSVSIEDILESENNAFATSVDPNYRGKLIGNINNTNYTFEYDKVKNNLTILKSNKKYLTATISLIDVIPEILKDDWISIRSPNVKRDNDLGKCLELLDNSPQSFFYYALDLQLYNENGEAIVTIKNEKGGSAYSYSSEALGYNSIEKTYKSATATSYLRIKPDNKQILDQMNLFELLSSRIVFDTKQTKGLLRNPNMDFGQELLSFANAYK